MSSLLKRAEGDIELTLKNYENYKKKYLSNINSNNYIFSILKQRESIISYQTLYGKFMFWEIVIPQIRK